MTTKQIYQLAIDLGVKNDLRGQNIVKRKLNRVKQQYAELPQAKKEEFDQERLVNPFSDTRYFGRPDKKVNKVMAGIDIDVAELLVARELGGIDLVIAHHPVGPALAGLHEVMDLQVELMAKYGVPINVAESLTHIRMSEVSRGISPVNHNKVLDAARNLGMEVMCVHTPSDNLVANFLDKYINQNKRNIETVGELMKLAVTEGRKTNPDLKIGICGEHGGHPASIAFCHKIGLTYVSCSGPRVPIARLAAAQAQLLDDGGQVTKNA